MKRLIRLVLIGAIGLVIISFMGRDALLAHLHGLGFGDDSALESGLSNEEGEQPVFFTEWLAGDLLNAALLPTWMQSEGKTAETMHAYTILHEARQDSEALVEESKRAARHWEGKEQSIARLVGRKIHLIDAATEWLTLDRSFGSGKVEHINRAYPGNSEIERYCQRVLWELESLSGREPHPYRDALARARGELRELKARDTYFSSN